SSIDFASSIGPLNIDSPKSSIVGFSSKGLASAKGCSWMCESFLAVVVPVLLDAAFDQLEVSTQRCNLPGTRSSQIACKTINATTAFLSLGCRKYVGTGSAQGTIPTAPVRP